MRKALVLDYSTDKKSGVQMRQWLPVDAAVTECAVDTSDSLADINLADYTHIIHSGSALTIMDEAPFTQAAHALIRDAVARGIWQFGICYGQQLLAQALVGPQAVRRTPKGVEVGWNDVDFTERGQDRLGVGRQERVWVYHYDEVTEMPPGSELIASTEHTRVQSFLNEDMKLFGTQFHPEFDLEEGNRLFRDDAEKLTAKGYDVDKLLKGTPSIDAAKVFFGFFLGLAD